MHILPNSRIPFSNLPLDVLISNKSIALKKRHEEEAASDKRNIVGGVRGTDLTPGALNDELNFFELDEFEAFPHVVALHDSALKAEPLIATYKKCHSLLELNKTPGMYNKLCK